MSINNVLWFVDIFIKFDAIDSKLLSNEKQRWRSQLNFWTIWFKSEVYGTIYQKCGRQTFPANSSDITVIHSASTNIMYENPTWWEFGSWYGCPPISSMWKPSGNMTAARQKSTTIKTIANWNGIIIHWSNRIRTLRRMVLRDDLLAVKPTHRAYGMTSRSQLLDASKIIAVVIQMQPTKMQIRASNHSGWSSGVKHTCGRLYRVIQVHIRPSLVSPKKKKCTIFTVYFHGVHQS